MKFIVSSSELLKHLQQISGVIGSNSVVPLLQDFLFTIDQNTLTIVATDLETTLKVTMEIEAKEAGQVCIPARILLDSLKNIADQPLTFTIDKSFAVEITSDNGKYKVMGENPEDFPSAPSTTDAITITLPSNVILSAITKCLYATSTDSLRPAMSGVFFELSEDNLTTVATDAHRLIKLTRTDVSCPEKASFIVPPKPLSLLKSLLSDNKDSLEISFTEKNFFLTQGTSEMACRLIDARFPDYRVVIPEKAPYTLRVNKTDFQQALRRVSLFSNKSTSQVALNITGSELQLEGQDIDFSVEGNERMVCSYDGEDMQITFNAKFLIEILSAADTEEILMELSTPKNAGIIRPSENKPDEDLLMLIMPLMVNN